MRGKQAAQLGAQIKLGLIPAHAGKTCANGGTSPTRPAHPRACGENVDYRPRPRPELGSSPRMRGKLSSTDAFFRFSRLIPAHAGKTHGNARASAGSAAHPRACGENLLACGQGQASQGSSPRIRGKRLVHRLARIRCGLIPAHAGKTPISIRRSRSSRAHPRACGENRFSEAHASDPHGSSPRMRGKRERDRIFHPPGRLIPAHAGKTACDSVG